jgi:hypothetical protein
MSIDWKFYRNVLSAIYLQELEMGIMNILAIGAHPDDIELGYGGLIVKAVRNGHDVYTG